MKGGHRFPSIIALAVGLMLVLRSTPGDTEARAHVYLFRGLADIFSTGMDTLADELNKRGVDASSHSHTEWKAIADKLVADYKAKKGGPIILVGHSLGADAVMEMSDYLGESGVPVALVVPFDGTQSFAATPNVGKVLNLTQRDYAYMRAGPGFHGSLTNVDVSSDREIDHINIDKSPRLHAQVIAAAIAVLGGHVAPPKPLANGTAKPVAHAVDGGSESPALPKPKPAETAKSATTRSDVTGTPVIARPEASNAPAIAPVPVPAPPPKPVAVPAVPPQTVSPQPVAQQPVAQQPVAPPAKPVAAPRLVNPAQIPD
jgi:hypothetical protein